MSTFLFNRIFVIESLAPDEFQTGSELKKRINQWAPTQGIECKVETFQVHSMKEWEITWNDIYTSISKCECRPIIHLEMHGNKSNIGIDGDPNKAIPLKDVFTKVQYANILSKNNIFLSLAVCMGLNVIRSLKVYEPMPFCGVLGSLETLQSDELLENYTIFYKAFLTSSNLDVAEQAMKKSGIDSAKYELIKPEQIFMNAYLGYLETYNTDEKIEKLALEDAKKENVELLTEVDKTRWNRDYKCQLLIYENVEYKRAVDTFFMFDRYPEISYRFIIPQTITDYKKKAAKDFGHDWISSKRYITSEDVKGISLVIMKDVHDFCDRNNIKYSLAYGTLIGAVRHKGFIPWDDDIDILMPRPDYDRFINLYSHDNENLFKVVSSETDGNYRYPFAKVVCNSTVKSELGYDLYGIGLDVFPIDKIPLEKGSIKRLFLKQNFYWNIFQLKVMKWDRERKWKKNIFLYLTKLALRFVPMSFIQRRMYRNALKYSQLSDYNMGCLLVAYGVKNVMPKHVFDEYILMPFEECNFWGLAHYDEYLSRLYGNYLQFPPKEQQVTHHDFVAYWK